MRASSRVIKKEQQKVVKQTYLFITTALVAVVVFVFLLLPGFISVVNSVIGSNPFEPMDTIPPQVPTLDIYLEATSEASLAISGNGEAGSKLTILVNGAKDSEVTIDEDRTFEVGIILNEGENIIKAFSTDDAGNDSAHTKPETVFYDTTNPFIELENLLDNQEIIGKENENYTIVGSTEPRATLLIDGRSVFVDSEGKFSTQIRLNEGENTLHFRAVDMAGNSTEAEFHVSFRY